MQQAEKDYPEKGVSKVPLLSVQFVSYLYRQNGKIQICDGDASEPYIYEHFPKFYSIGPQEYLVEQPCEGGHYNSQFSYLIYRPNLPLAQVEMQKFPEKAYERTERGYRLKGKGLNQSELTIPEGELIPLTFDGYFLDQSGKRVHSVKDWTGGRRLYEPKTRTLWVWGKGRGTADCGSFFRYQLRNSKFVLLEAPYQRCCDTKEECNAPGYHRPPHEYPLIYP